MSEKLIFYNSDSDSEWNINKYKVFEESDVLLLMKFVVFKSLRTSLILE